MIFFPDQKILVSSLYLAQLHHRKNFSERLRMQSHKQMKLVLITLISSQRRILGVQIKCVEKCLIKFAAIFYNYIIATETVITAIAQIKLLFMYLFITAISH